ncbi:hypothetical protein [Bacterioplanoides pacificum]|uniref:DUF4145 domain-containing protein n=1 Tax=Bacterioplanoides pacificum TaxID=1171596 RepID=A0ABV7VP81_9GAMM
MSIIEQVINHTKKAEHILETHFKAEGRGMHEKLSHAERYIPAPLLKKLRYVATIRNKMMHEHDFELSEPEIFLDTARKAVAQLEELVTDQTMQRAKTMQQDPASGLKPIPAAKPRRRFWRWVMVMLVLYMGYQWLINQKPTKHVQPLVIPEGTKTIKLVSELGQQNTEVRAALQKPQPKPSSASQTTKHEPKSSAKVTEKNIEVADKKDIPKPISNTDKNETSAWRKHMQQGRHTAIPNNYLEITDIRLSYREGSFRSTEPFIEITVNNKTELYLSSAKLDARLYIQGQKEPAVDTSAGRSRENLYIFFGDHGLKPNSTVTTRVSMGGFSEERWKSPDILNASDRQLILNLIGISDGMRKSVPIKSSSFDQLGVHSGLDTNTTTANQVAKVLPDISKLKTIFSNGDSVGIGNADLEILDVKLQYTKGSFGRIEPNIQVTVRNQSDKTLSSGYVHARLYLNNGRTPVFTTQKPLYVGFGERGLMSGETRTERVYIGGFDDRQWVSPDILNAQNRKVMLKLESLRDGMERTMQSPPASFFEP